MNAFARSTCLSLPVVFRFSFLSSLILSFLCLFGTASLRAQNANLVPLSSVLVGGLGHPDDIVTDQAGSVYIADTLHNTVLKVTYSNGTPTQQVVASGLGGPAGIAVDSNGDVYIVETTKNDIVKETLSAGTYAPAVIASGLVHPFGVVLDSSNNLYVSVSTGVWMFPVAGGAHTVIASGLTNPQGLAIDLSGYVLVADYVNNRVLQIAGSFLTPVVTGLNGPRGLAVDAAGSLYIADSGSGTILKEPNISYSSNAPSIVATGFSNDYGVAVDSEGNFYVADTGNNQALRLQVEAVDFGFANVGSSIPQTLTFEFSSPGSSVGGVVVSTEGVAGKDFQETSPGTCDAAATYVPGNTCTVNVKFSPTVPGLRAGSALLLDPYGDIIATAYLHGIGVGPQVAFNPGTVSTILTGFEGKPQYSSGLDVDPAGNLFVTVSGVNEIPAAGGPPTPLPLFPLAGGNTLLTGSGDLIAVYSLSFQSHGGQVYYDENLEELRWNGSGYNAGYSFDTTTTDPNPPTLYADSRGNFYQVNSAGILEFPQFNAYGPFFIPALPPDIINNSSDGKGNLYTLLPSGSVQKTDRTHPPALAFANTAVGSTSSDSPRSFTTTNIGNAPLIFPTPAMGLNPGISPSFAVDSSTTCPQIGSATPPASLAAGANCIYAVKFVPAVAASILGSLVLTDTNLNAVYATQTAALSGKGVGGASGQLVFSPSGVAFGNVKLGLVSSTVSVTATNNSTSAASYVSFPGRSYFNFQPGTCGTFDRLIHLAPGASCTFMVNFAPAVGGQVSGTLTLSTTSGPVTFPLSGNGVPR